MQTLIVYGWWYVAPKVEFQSLPIHLEGLPLAVLDIHGPIWKYFNYYERTKPASLEFSRKKAKS